MHQRIPAVLLLTMVSGCSPEVERPPLAGLPLDTVHAEPLAFIGELDGPADYLFGNVASVAVGPDSAVYVADALGTTVRAYSLAGEYLATIGSEGDGPGEFRFLEDLSYDPQGFLYVRQRHRVTVFGSRSGPRALRDSLVRTVGLSRSSLERARAKTDGVLYYSPTYYYFMFVRHRYLYEVLDSMGPTGDTVPVPLLPHPEVLGRANYPVPGGGIPVEGVNLAPFEPRPSWDLTPEARVLMTTGRDYEVFEILDSGDTLRIIDVEVHPIPVPSQARRDSAIAFGERLDSIPVPLDQMRGMSDLARSRELPDNLPEILRLHVAPSGEIWIQRWPVSGASVFDVFDEVGSPLYTVRVPSVLITATPPFLSSGVIAGVVQDAVTGVQRVAVFWLPQR